MPVDNLVEVNETVVAGTVVPGPSATATVSIADND
jgi:hypothetical protein